MMRRYHRWLAVFFAPFLFWIASTGLIMQLTPVWQKAFGAERPAAAPVTPAGGPPPGFRCPETMMCWPKPKGGEGLVGRLHSGGEFGRVGKLLSIASGCSLLFFAFSGAWMYLRMWRDRRRRASAPRWFW